MKISIMKISIKDQIDLIQDLLHQAEAKDKNLESCRGFWEAVLWIIDNMKNDLRSSKSISKISMNSEDLVDHLIADHRSCIDRGDWSSWRGAATEVVHQRVQLIELRKLMDRLEIMAWTNLISKTK